MKRIFDLKDIIKKQANFEAEIEHANDPRPELPVYVKPEIVRGRAGWINFFLSLRP